MTTGHPEAVVPSHLYAHPLDEVLRQAETLLVEKGWKVQRSGDELATNWVHLAAPASRSEEGPVATIATSAPKPADVIGYRVYGERIDDGYESDFLRDHGRRIEPLAPGRHGRASEYRDTQDHDDFQTQLQQLRFKRDHNNHGDRQA